MRKAVASSLLRPLPEIRKGIARAVSDAADPYTRQICEYLKKSLHASQFERGDLGHGALEDELDGFEDALRRIRLWAYGAHHETLDGGPQLPAIIEIEEPVEVAPPPRARGAGLRGGNPYTDKRSDE